MFRSITFRLITIFIIVLVAGFSITGIALYFFLGDFLSDEKENLLGKSGAEIQEFLKEYIKSADMPIAQLYLSKVLNLYSINTGSIIFVANNNGVIINMGPDSNRIPTLITDHLKGAEGILRFPDPKQYNDVVQGREFKDIGDFYGLYKDTGYAWITVGIPFRYNNGNSEEVLGGIYLSAPVPGIEMARKKVFSFYMMSTGLSIAMSIFIAYLFSLGITRPLKQIRNAAKVIGSGDFQKRLNIHSKDEVGDLARTFDNMVSALQNLEEMRRGFIANVSHELRTPMTSIKGFIEGILDRTIPEEKHGYYLSIVNEEADRLNRLVNDLLDLARMESGELKLVYSVFNINELIRRCIIKLEAMFIKKQISVEAIFEEDAIFANADMDAIERVILNLLHNALKFTPDNGKVKITTSNLKNKVTVSIEDNGTGIRPEEISMIWERFYKTDKSRGLDKGGTGLGLAIIKNIINEHKQEITVKSEYGKGSIFTFTIDKA